MDLEGADDLDVAVPDDLQPGPWVLSREVEGRPLRLVLPVLDGADAGYARAGERWLFPGLARLGAPRPSGLPLVVSGAPSVVEVEAEETPADPLDVTVESTAASVRLGWKGAPDARWLVEQRTPDGPRVLTPVPLSNPVFELGGLPALSKLELAVSRLGRTGETVVEARTTFPFQEGFPQVVGANLTSVQLLDLDGKHGKEILFGDDAKGLWALNADGSEVRHAGDCVDLRALRRRSRAASSSRSWPTS